jgi:PPM family protein phosphatase
MAVTSQLISAGHTDVGRKRVENEDRILIDPQRGIYLVVDGIGGHAAGERAARVASDIISMRLGRQTGSTVKRVREAFALASTEIFETASRDSGLTGMACVATLAIIEDDRVTVGHVGDSRLYLLEPGTIRKVTHDHSPVGEREDAGELSEDAAMLHPRRNEVYRDLGSLPHAPDDPDFVEIQQFHLPPSSALLLCSDGLTDQVPAEEIRQLVEKHAGDPESGTRALITAANKAGGKDNVSVVLVETPQYAGLQEHSQLAAGRLAMPGRRSFGIGLLAGVLAAAVLFAGLRPYVEQAPSGRVLRFGTARPPRTLVVGPDAFKTISDAMERARPGDTISVSPGEYHENLSLHNGVSVISSELRGAKLSGLSTSGAVVAAENVHHARFSGFDILGPGEVGVRISNSDVEIASVRISGMHGTGLEIDGGQSSFQASVVEQNAGIGVYVHGAASPRIDHNTIVNNGHGAEPSPGVFIAGTATPNLSGNVITNNGAEQVWTSPLYNAANLLKDNVIAPTLREGSNHDIKVVTR